MTKKGDAVPPAGVPVTAKSTIIDAIESAEARLKAGPKSKRNKKTPEPAGLLEEDEYGELETTAPVDATQGNKKNFAQYLSEALAVKVADALRVRCPGVTPFSDGTYQETPALGVKGPKKLDVNYSTEKYGLALGISIKTINAKDEGSSRYTKNYGRNDNELRAEAMDYHRRQPYAVMAALIFIPVDACDDGKKREPPKRPKKGAPPPALKPCSFGAAVRYFRHRAMRRTVKNDSDLFEKVYIGIYAPQDPEPDKRDGFWNEKGDMWFFDVEKPPPLQGRPRKALLTSFDEAMEDIYEVFVKRNTQAFEWDKEP